MTRDYNLHLDSAAAPLLSVYGGKITTYRRLAEEVLKLLAKAFTVPGEPWTASHPLPGGDIPNTDFDAFVVRCRARYAWLPDPLLHDYAHLYGTRIALLLEGCEDVDGLGQHFGGPLYQREVEYLIEHEFAESAEDILWRRTKKGLFLSTGEIEQFTDWMGHNPDAEHILVN